MRLFADHCVPTDIIRVLREMGFEVIRAYDVGLDRAEDESIFDYARRHGAILVTVDRDFCNIVRFQITKARGVVLIELEAFSKQFVRERLEGFFSRLTPQTIRGRLAILKPSTVTIWPKSRHR